MTTKHGAAGIIMARHLDAGMSLRDAVSLTRADMLKQGCELAEDAEERVKAAACEAIEKAETRCPVLAKIDCPVPPPPLAASHDEPDRRHPVL